MEQLPTPHNNFFRFALSDLPNARNLIETQLSSAALAELDLQTLQLETGSFIDPDLREKFSDLLFSVKLAQEMQDAMLDEALVYFLFEHKSQTDPLTVLQLLSYIIRIWEKRLRDGLPLCPIVPLVVYHGERGWTAAKSLRELIPTPSGLAEYQIDFRLPLLDLSQLSDEEISGEPILRSTLRLLKYSRSKQLVGKLTEILQLIAQSLPQGSLPQWIQAIGVYVMTVNKDIGAEEYKQTLKSILPTQFEPGSLADRLLIQGREEGREEGLKRGELRGKLQLLQEMLGEPLTANEELDRRPLSEISRLIIQLQSRMRNRNS
ncbi:MAG: Rpn family recombination-promoting nuclease/putative transposase [Pirellulaceae bacterium]